MAINHEFIIPKAKKGGPDHNDPLVMPRLMMIVGGTGAGKTTLIGNLLMALEAKHDFDEALFVTGNNRDEFLQTLEMPITTSPVDLEKFITKIGQPSSTAKKNILILDDLQGSPDFNIVTGRSQFSNFILSHRHFGKVNGEGGTWVIATVQRMLSSYTPNFRKNVTNWFTFPPREEEESKLIEGISGDRKKMKKAMSLQSLENRHSFLFVNRFDPTDVKYFMGFNKELDVS